MSFQQARYDEPLLFELEGEDRPPSSPEGTDLPKALLRGPLGIPDVPESRVVRHFTRLSQMNMGIDTEFYPLGSCTMKYNPKYAEALSRFPQVQRLHPLADPSLAQGSLQVLFELQEALKAISGMHAVSLQPAAGAQGEYTGLLMVRAFQRDKGEARHQVVLPDHAHGTNFSSAAMAGFDVVEIPSKGGTVDLKALKAALSEDTAAFMLTNPNTLGIFEGEVLEIAHLVHEAGALLYYDGANFNAILGKTNPGRMHFDIVHFNLHKTFATPHGGGGPGAGPVGVTDRLEPYLPLPIITFDGRRYGLDYDRPKSVGKVRAFHGNFGVLLRAYANILRWGSDGMEERCERAVLNANYLRHQVEATLEVPFPGLRKHEFVATARSLRARGVRALDVAKRLMDHGFHPPTVYFPSLVEEALMVEPTETESRATLDRFAAALAKIAHEDPEVVRSAPHRAAVARVDEVGAARQPILSWSMLRASAQAGGNRGRTPAHPDPPGLPQT